MKKILTASLVAMMAVTAANADIASTKYVNTQSGLPESQATFNVGDFTGAAAQKTNLKDAVNAIATEVAGLTEGGEGSVSSQIESAIGTLADGATDVATAISKAQQAAEGKVTALADGQVKTNKEAIEAINNESTGILKQAKDYTDALKTNEVATNTAAIAKLSGTGEGSVSKAVADAKDELKGLIDSLGETNGANETAIEQLGINLEKAITDAADDATSKANQALADAKIYADQAEADAISTAAGDATTKANEAQAAAEATAAGALATAKSELQGEINAVKAGTSLATGAVKTANIANKAVTETQLSDSVNASLDLADSALQAADKLELEGKITGAQSAAESTAKTYTDNQLKSYTNTDDMTSAIATARGEAIADAKSKADQALVDAKAYADQAEADAKSDAAGKYQVKSSNMSIGAAGGAWTDLTAVTGYSTTGTHSLVLKAGQIQWEEVKY